MGEPGERPDRTLTPAANTTSDKLGQILELLDGFTDEDERAMVLIGYAERFHEVPPEVARRPFPADHRVEYCESEAYVWLLPRPDGTVKLHFAVENPSGISAKALAAILDESLSGLTPEAIVTVSSDIVARIFRQNISMGKGMGLTGMVQTVQRLARQMLEV
jgi:cysteine desulfuration protein SufE